MKKIKEIWMNNRILLVLAIIVLTCFIIMAVVCFNMFFGATKSVYGDRLDGMENYALKEEDKEKIINKLKENENTTDVSVHTQGKIIYIRAVFTNTTLERAKEIASTTLEVINDEYKEKYDIHYTLVSEKSENNEGFTIMGAKNINRNLIIWNNNNPMPEPESEGE